MSRFEQSYLNSLQHIKYVGETRKDRTGVGTSSIFGDIHLSADLREGFPMLTTKRVHWKSVVAELLWFLSGSSNIKYLNDNGVTIWDEWADSAGNLGPVYGVQWRKWRGHSRNHDQISDLIHGLKNDPYGRRHIVSSWNVGQLDLMALPPCHSFFQCYVHNDKRLDLVLTQRSADFFLGVPFNISSYALLVHILAKECDLIPGKVTINFGDAHIYLNHMEQVDEQLSRQCGNLPTLEDFEKRGIGDYSISDFQLSGYDPLPSIKAPIAI